jgi:hypothetical protein
MSVADLALALVMIGASGDHEDIGHDIQQLTAAHLSVLECNMIMRHPSVRPNLNSHIEALLLAEDEARN